MSLRYQPMYVWNSVENVPDHEGKAKQDDAVEEEKRSSVIVQRYIVS